MRSSELGTRPAEAIVAAILVGAVAAILWLPALSTPFWGDDYVFLEDALRARLSGNEADLRVRECPVEDAGETP